MKRNKGQFVKGVPSWNKGTHLSGMKGKHHRPESKLKSSLSQSGEKNHMFGKKIPKEVRKKMGRKGENHYNWKGGITHNQKMEMLAGRKRPDTCECCGTPAKDLKKALSYDHNHITGQFRGWLCRRCNMVLGSVNDSVQLLEMLIIYLKQNDKN
jgi:hypothetical protein